ncbi:MAG: ABC transporter permease [Phycicoccus sp.]
MTDPRPGVQHVAGSGPGPAPADPRVPTRSGQAERAGVPSARLFRVELRKLLDTRAGRWLAGSTALVSVLAVAAFLVWGDNDEATFEGLLGLAVLPLVVLLPILGIMSATAEWSQRTGMVTFALEPHRGRVVAAKLAAAAVLALGVVATAVAGTALAHLVAGAFLDLPGDWSVPGAVVGGIALAMVVYLVQGVAFGLVFLNTPLAIVLSLVLPTAFTIVGALVSGFKRVATWLDLSRATEPLLGGSMGGQDWAHLGTASLLWLGLPLTVGTWRVMTREVA